MARSPHRDSPAKMSHDPGKEQDFPIVGVGASAGGLEAFTLLLGALPADIDMAFVLVQHLDPSHKSGLVELLARDSKLPVREVEDGVKVQPRMVYVNPENAEVTIENNGTLRLHARADSKQPSLPINRFLLSLADDQRDNAIGVILSGAIDDGTVGLQAIRECGGITFAQDQTASVRGMPESAIQADVVDFVLPPAQMAGVLVRISDKSIARADTVAAREPAVNGLGLDAILAHVRQVVGVDMAPYKLATLGRRIHRRLVLLNLANLAEYAKYLEDNPAEVHALYQDMLINVSHMFRDQSTLDFLKNEVLPTLAAKRTAEQPIRIWVAGCASGEEAYSMAIICREFLDRWSLAIPVRIFATDVSARMIAQARSGLYAARAVDDVAEERLKQFFTREGDNYRVNQSIREMCVFAEHNLLTDPPFSRMDIISCCNVLIYFKPASQQKLINTFHYALKPAGYLVLSPSETVGTSRALFSLLDKTHKVYTRKAAMTPSHLNTENNQPLKPTASITRHVVERSEGELDVGKLADNLLLARFTPGSVVIDSDMEIVQFRGVTSMYLEPGSGKASLNIFKMARPGLAMHLRKAIREVKKDRQPFQCTTAIKHDKKTEHIKIEVLPLIANTTAEPYLLVVFAEETDTLNADRDALAASEAKSSKSDAKDRQILHLDLELGEAQDEMRRISDEHETVVQELQLSNEEIRSANEELQTLNEELETSSEELASSNEELITMNQSLRDSNDQLKMSRDFAEAIISTVRESLLVLGPDLRVRTASNSFYRTFSVTREATEGKYIYDLGDGQWQIPALRSLLEDILPKNSNFQDYVVKHDFPGIGPKVMLLNARRILTSDEGDEHMVLLAIEDITNKPHADSSR